MSNTEGPEYPFERLAHIQITGRYSGSSLHDLEIVFKNFLPMGEPATRDIILKYRGFALDQCRSQLGVSLGIDAMGDSISVLTKRGQATTS